MSSLKLKKRPKVVIEFEDREISLERPNAFAMAEMEDLVKKEMEEGSAKKLVEYFYSFIVKLGMPEDLAKELDFEHYEEIFKALKGSKKN